MNVLMGQGYEEVGQAYVQDTILCDRQTAFVKAGGFILLKNEISGAKALCCLNAKTLKSRATAACSPVGGDYVLGPDVFGGDTYQ